jgi:hypothetical protein
MVEIFLKNEDKIVSSDQCSADFLVELVEQICIFQPKVETVSPFI